MVVPMAPNPGDHTVVPLYIFRPPEVISGAGSGGRIPYLEAKRRQATIRRVVRQAAIPNLIAFPILRRIR